MENVDELVDMLNTGRADGHLQRMASGEKDSVIHYLARLVELQKGLLQTFKTSPQEFASLTPIEFLIQKIGAQCIPVLKGTGFNMAEISFRANDFRQPITSDNISSSGGYLLSDEKSFLWLEDAGMQDVVAASLKTRRSRSVTQPDIEHTLSTNDITVFYRNPTAYGDPIKPRFEPHSVFWEILMYVVSTETEYPHIRGLNAYCTEAYVPVGDVYITFRDFRGTEARQHSEATLSRRSMDIIGGMIGSLKPFREQMRAYRQAFQAQYGDTVSFRQLLDYLGTVGYKVPVSEDDFRSVEHDNPSPFPFSAETLALLQAFKGSAEATFAVALGQGTLQMRATYDSLTGLANKAHLMGKLEAAYDEYSRGQARSMALAMIDIDHFKHVNDTYGHPGGDVVLREVSGRILRSVRHVDLAARVGGEEFTVLLPGANIEHAGEVAERIHRAIGSSPVPYLMHEIPVTASIGVAGLDGMTSVEEWIRAADTLLYQAKAKGRNRVVITGQNTRADAGVRAECVQSL